MNQKNKEVITKIIAAVETGGQVYGQADYANYGKPYQNTKNEHTITLGWGGFYGERARRLIQMIFDRDAAFFAKTDKKGAVFNVLNKNWETMRWHPTTSEKNVLIALIDSPVGHQCQDELFQKELLDAYLKQVAKDYPKADVKAQMMYCEIHHLGGRNGVNRIFKRCNGKYDLDTIMASLVADQRDKSSDNQVGDKIFWSRHLKCRQYIDEYSVPEGSEETHMTAKDIIICGHGSKTPSTKNFYTYSASRYSQKASNGKRKGIVAVRRLKALTDDGRKKFHDKYKTILGRNQYNQNLRQYVYTPYSNGKYYSDCSSSICATYAEIGYNCPLLNTAGIYTDSRFETVPVIIKDGQVQNCEILKVGDCILYVGNDPARPLQIGHVEAIYEMPTNPSPTPTPTPTDDKKLIKEGQKQLNNFLADYIKKGELDPLVVDGELGKKTLFNLTWAFQYAMNRSYNVGLEVDGIFGRFSEAAARDYYTRYGQKSYVVSVLEIGMLLHALDPKGIEYPGIYGNGLRAAVMAYQGDPNFGRSSWKRLLTSTN
jgi:hypothetical protein